jgi:Protein of unknown function (DUF2934)
MLHYCSFVFVLDRSQPTAPCAVSPETQQKHQSCGRSFAVESPDDLREQARHLRQLATGIDDRRTLEAIAELAAEYEAVAARMERFNLTRKRAYEMWEEQGQPEGLHAAHWHDAEVQVGEEERNAGKDPARREP